MSTPKEIEIHDEIDTVIEEFISKYSKNPELLDAYVELLDHLEKWTDELAKQGPEGVQKIKEGMLKLLLMPKDI